MKKFVYIPTGRRQWFEVAVRLLEQDIARPCAWIGDAKLDKLAESQFPDCEVVNLRSVMNDLHGIEFTARNSRGFMDRPDLLEIRDRAFRMMDRRDPYGAYHTTDRDMTFYRTCLYAISSLERWQPDFVQFIDAPHSVIHYLLYEAAGHLGIPTWSFSPWSFAPVISLRRGIFGEPIKIEPANRPIDIRSTVDEFLEKFRDDNKDFDPFYMQRQKRIDRKNKSMKARIHRTVIKPMKQGRDRLSENAGQSKEKGLLDDSRLHFLEPLFRQHFVEKRRRTLQQRLTETENTAPPLNEKYAFYPLQYEPERTTVPDGMDHYDQCRTLIRLREFVPGHIPILVKEHYSQLTRALEGFKGRSPQFYNLVEELDNCHMVPVSAHPRELIKNSLLTVSITGSAALEAACMGTLGMTFGCPWFRGVPGVVQYRTGLDFETATSTDPTNMQEIANWLIERFETTGLFGCINPSNRKHFDKFYSSEDSEESELCGIVAAIRQAVSEPTRLAAATAS